MALRAALAIALPLLLLSPAADEAPVPLRALAEIEAGDVAPGSEVWVLVEIAGAIVNEKELWSFALRGLGPVTRPVLGFAPGEVSRTALAWPTKLRIPYDSWWSTRRPRWYCVRGTVGKSESPGLAVESVPEATVEKLNRPIRPGDRLLSVEDGFGEDPDAGVPARALRLEEVRKEQALRPLMRGVALREGERVEVEWRPSKAAGGARVTVRPIPEFEIAGAEATFLWSEILPPEGREYEPRPPLIFHFPRCCLRTAENRDPLRAQLTWTSEPEGTGKVDPATNREIMRYPTEFRLALQNEGDRAVLACALRLTFDTPSGERRGVLALASFWGFRTDLFLEPREKSTLPVPMQELDFQPRRLTGVQVLYWDLPDDVLDAIRAVLPEAGDVEIVAQPLRDGSHRITFVNGADRPVGIAGRLPNRRKTGYDFVFEIALGAGQKAWHHRLPKGRGVGPPQPARFTSPQLLYLWIPCEESLLPEEDRLKTTWDRDRDLSGRLCWERAKREK